MRIKGAWFDEEVNLVEAEIAHELWLDRSRLTADVDVHRIRTKSPLSLRGSLINGTLNMDGAIIRNNLLMSEGAEFSKVILRSARIEGELALVGAKVTGTLDMSSARIDNHVFTDKGAEFAKVIVSGAKIAGQLSLDKATVTGTLGIDGADIAGPLFMRKARFSKPISMIFTRIGSNLDLRGSALPEVDLTGTRIDGEFRLASGSSASPTDELEPPKWSNDASLVLRNTRVGALQDEPEAWPQHLDLHGFAYERFGGFGASPKAAVGKRGSEWFKEWLARDEPFTPEPYHRCAKMLREMGHPEMADNVLYAGRERGRVEAGQSSKLRWLGLSLLNWTVGYGYGHRYFRSLWWVLGFVALGTLVLLINGQIDKTGGTLLTGAFFSLDLLLPIIQLHEPHYRIVLDGFTKYYFAVHKLMGYVLASS